MAWQHLIASNAQAHDPPDCEQFGGKIMRFFNDLERDRRTKRRRLSGKTGFHFADRALQTLPVLQRLQR